MMKYGFLVKKLYRSFLEVAPKNSREKALIDKKLLKSKDLSSFLNDIEISTTSLPMLAYLLKICLDNPQNHHLEQTNKLFQIKNEIVNNLDKLDSEGIMNFCESAAKSNSLNVEASFSTEKKKILITRISELISSHSFDQNQILSIYENLMPQGFKIDELENEIIKILDNLSDINLKEFSRILSKTQIIKIYKNNESARERLIEKIKSVGLSDKDIVSTICNKTKNLNSSYLASTISCLAELRFEKQKWATDMANNLVDYAEDKRILFESDLEYINWIYGLVSFNVGKSVILKYLKNSQNFECKQLTFKHFLLANHFNLDSNFKGVDILDMKTHRYWRDFDYFKHFGIDKSYVDYIESSFRETSLEVKTGIFTGGVWVPFYISSRKTCLWPKTNAIFLYNSKNFKGEFYMHRTQILRKLKNIFIFNREDIDHIDNIRQYLNI